MSIESKIIDSVRLHGPVSYAEFMQLCLYEFEDSYYRKQDPIGFQADFYTSPFLHPIFGSLIGIKLFYMWNALKRPDVFEIVELGAGNGQLSTDILDYAKHISKDFYDAIQYTCVEVRHLSGEIRGSHSDKVHFIGMEEFLLCKIHGCVLSNEFFDAIPVHRVCRKNDELFEIKVEWYESGLRETFIKLTDARISKHIEKWDVDIPEGYTVEINLLAESIIDNILGILKEGFILTIDYGDLPQDLYGIASRKNGTLRSFKNNIQVRNILDAPGTQDITCHVNFAILMDRGEKSGFKLEEFISQRQFMMDLGCGIMLSKLDNSGIERTMYVLNKRRIENLLDESGLGGFKVLVQSKCEFPINISLSEDMFQRLRLPILTTDR